MAFLLQKMLVSDRHCEPCNGAAIQHKIKDLLIDNKMKKYYCWIATATSCPRNDDRESAFFIEKTLLSGLPRHYMARNDD